MQRKLKDPILVARDQAANLPEGRTAALLVGQIEIRVVDEIEHLAAKRQTVILGESKILEQGQVHDRRSRAVAVRPSRIAKSIRSGLGERFRIEPLSELLILRAASAGNR